MKSNMLNAYESAYNIACEKLSKRNPEEISLNSNCVYDKSNNCILVSYMGEDYRINCKNGEVIRLIGNNPVKTTVKVLILHYLLHSIKRQSSGKLISFREVRGGGANYYPTFYKRAILPLQKTFAKNSEKLILAGIKLKGKSATYGDASVTVPVFPLIPVTYVIWQGDDEIPSSATILFDSNVSSYLSCEDIVIAASFGTYKLMNVKKSL